MGELLLKKQFSKFPHTSLLLLLLVILIIQQSYCLACSVSIANCNNQCQWWDSTWCSSCAAGYHNILKNCCKNQCASCTPDSVTCNSCINGYCLSSGSCLRCDSFVAGCTRCTSCGTCSSCSSFNFFGSPTPSTQTLVSSTECSTCIQLMADCLECSSTSACTKCVNNSFTVDSGPTPDQCVPCTDKLTNCATCGYPRFSSSLQCYSCFNNTYGVKDSDQKCYPCSTLMPNCLTCSSQTVCTQCQATYAYSSSSCQLCSDLMANCINCTLANACTECVDDTFAINSTNQCDLCSSISKLTGCLTCSSSSVCLTCIDTSYIIDSSLCAACSSLMPGCLNCSSISVCTVCTSDTYILNATTTKCDACSSLLSGCLNCTSASACTACINNSYVFNVSKCESCQNLMNGCMQCNSSTICTACVNNSYALNTSNNLCYACSAYMSFCKNCNNAAECINCDGAPNVILAGQNCSQCGVVIPNCLNCTSTAVCTFCNKYYIVSSAFSCVLCANVMYGCVECSSTAVCTKCSFGQIVANGCSSVPGCIAVSQTSSSSICTSCNTAYISTPTAKGTCVCLKGHLAGQYCTQIIGCLNIIRTSIGDICTACDSTNRFNLQNKTCVCQQYYQISGSSCVQICGDGRLITLPCDDGNVFSGDGCSSSCQIETGYHCTGGTITNATVCIYVGFARLHPVCVYKQQGNNAQIILTLKPSISNLQKSKSQITLVPSSKYSMDSFSFVGSNIIIKISYSETIEGQTVNVTIEYDKNYIDSPNSSTEVKLIQCQGDRLIYDPNVGQTNKTMIIMLTKVISLLALLVWFIGSYSHKMIGVETLHTIQLIFIPQVLATRYFPVIIYFSELSNTLHFYKTKFTTSTPLTSTTQNRLNYSADFIYNDCVIGFLQLIILVVFAILVISDELQCCLTQRQRKKQKIQKHTSISIFAKFRQFIYDFLVFPAFVGFFLNFILSLMIHSNAFQKKFSNQGIQTFVILLTAFSTSFIFFLEWKQFFIKEQLIKQELNHRPNYIPLYLTYFFILCLVIEASLTFLIPNSIFFLFGLTFVYTIIIIFYRPYHSWIHNIGLLINHTGVVLNLCWIISQEFIYLTRINQQMIALVLIIWMFIILIFALFRIIFQIRRTKCLKIQNNQQGKKQAKQCRDYEMQIMKAIEQQTSANINSYLVQSQLIRYKKIQQQLLYQRKKKQISYQLSNKSWINEQKNNGKQQLIRGLLKESLRMPFNQQYQYQT